jgi:hypothetical protein
LLLTQEPETTRPGLKVDLNLDELESCP